MRFPALHRERKELNGKWLARFHRGTFNRRGAIVALVGPRGTGKTQMATELARDFPDMDCGLSGKPDTAASWTSSWRSKNPWREGRDGERCLFRFTRRACFAG